MENSVHIIFNGGGGFCMASSRTNALRQAGELSAKGYIIRGRTHEYLLCGDG
jgi:hypothetical protein